MMMDEKIKKITYDEFLEFAKKNKQTHFLNSLEWVKFREKIDWKYEILGVYKNQNLIGAAMLLSKKIAIINKNFFYIPRGMVIDYENYENLNIFTKSLKEYTKLNNGIFVRIDPQIKYQELKPSGDIVDGGINNQKIVDNLKKVGFKHLGFTKEFEGMQPRFTFRIKLKDRDLKDILKNMDSKTRYNSKIGPKRGIEIIEQKPIEIDNFYELMEDTAKRDGFIVRSKEYFEILKKTIDKENPAFVKQYFAKLNPKKYFKILEEEQEEISRNLIKLDKTIDNLDDTTGKKYQKLKNQKDELLKRDEQNKEKFVQAEEIRKKYPNGVNLATAICIVHDNKCWHLFGASSQEYIQFRAVYQLITYMIEDSYNSGYDFFDHFGSPGIFEKDSSYYGLYYFKRGFGGELVEFIGEFDLINNKIYYNLFIRLIGKVQNSKQNFILKFLLNFVNRFK